MVRKLTNKELLALIRDYSYDPLERLATILYKGWEITEHDLNQLLYSPAFKNISIVIKVKLMNYMSDCAKEK